MALSTVVAANPDKSAVGTGQESMLELPGNAGNPFWPLGEEEAHRAWHSMATGYRAEGTSVRRVARWLWQPAPGSGRSGAALAPPPLWRLLDQKTVETA
jgi:hypothetical protein